MEYTGRTQRQKIRKSELEVIAVEEHGKRNAVRNEAGTTAPQSQDNGVCRGAPQALDYIIGSLPTYIVGAPADDACDLKGCYLVVTAPQSGLELRVLHNTSYSERDLELLGTGGLSWDAD